MPSYATALYLTLAYHQEGIATRLLDAGADPILQSSYRKLPMHLATSSGMVRRLHEAGTTSNFLSEYERENGSVLFNMIKGGVSIDAMEAIIDVVPTTLYRSPVHFIRKASIKCRPDVIRLLLEKGITWKDVDARDMDYCMTKSLLNFNATISTPVLAELVGLIVEHDHAGT